MSDTTIRPGGAAGGPAGPPVEPASRVRGGERGGFAAALRRSEESGQPGPSEPTGGGAGEMLRDAARSIDRGKHMIDSVLRAARNGRTFSQEELLAIQAGVYRYTQELELASKLVDKATGAVRHTLQSQQ